MESFADLKAVWEYYSPRMKDYMRSVVAYLQENTDWNVGGVDAYYGGDVETSSVSAWINAGEGVSDNDVNIDFCLIDGTYDEDGGIAFSVNVNNGHGKTICGMGALYNYSNRVWAALDDPDEIESRFQHYLDGDLDTLIENIREYLSGLEGDE